jgi:putative redox protein
MGVSMSLDYMGELRCKLEHGPSHTVIDTDAPTDNGGRGAAFSPTDLVGAALLSCAVTTMAIKGPKEGIAVERAKGRVVKDMTQTPPRKIAKLTVEIELPASLSEAQRARLEEIGRTCPVALSLGADVEVAMNFSYRA